jgi:hypothetical protein
MKGKAGAQMQVVDRKQTMSAFFTEVYRGRREAAWRNTGALTSNIPQGWVVVPPKKKDGERP